MADRDTLIEAAREAMGRAYAPYSRFQVGAAIRTPSGTVYAGANVENAAYPQGVCAEASAISAMIMGGETTIAEMAVIGHGEGLVTPCGGCRQKIREFAAGHVPIHIAGNGGHRATFTVAELLPHSFGPEHLGQGQAMEPSR